jgi:hypothetical protein
MAESTHTGLRGPVALGVVLFTLLLVPAAAPAANLRFSHPTRIDNPFLPISEFHRCRLSGRDEGDPISVTRTVLGRTRRFRIDGRTVHAAVVRDRVTSRGSLIESTHDFFAQNDGGSVYYLGERVSEYEHGKLVSHEGQWMVGKDTRHPGLLMPAHPRFGDSWRSERVPGVSHEIDRVVRVNGHDRIGDRRYRHVITVREDARPPREIEFKRYARGTGVITEANGSVRLRGCR